MSRKKESTGEKEANLKHLSRLELLEMLLDEEKRIASLEKELAQAKAELAKRTILIENSGSIAEAALKLNGIFEAAQAAADQYLENIRQLGQADTPGEEMLKKEDDASESPAGADHQEGEAQES
jgi:cell division septum initiation protein DivIVA